MGLLERLREGLQRTRSLIQGSVATGGGLDPSFYERLEEALVAADLGIDEASALVKAVSDDAGRGALRTPSEAYRRVKETLVAALSVARAPDDFPQRPWVVLVTGVNGVGKTTTIGKMAHAYRGKGRRVMLAAADTFRAGAIEQLRIWAERTSSEFISQKPGSDPASVAFDALDAARARGVDVLLVDTAGRLHSKESLMNELAKVVRVVRRAVPTAPNEVLLVIDGTTGRNALRQAESFHRALGLTGLVVTKLDGTAKGGAVVGIARALGVPVRMIGVGEGIEDLQDFNAAAFVDAMFGDLDGAGGRA